MHPVISVLCIVGIIWFVFAAFAFGHMFDTIGTEDHHAGHGGDMPLRMVVGTTMVMNLILAFIAILNGLCGLNLLKRRNHGFTRIVAIFNCLMPPVGTLLGAFTLIMLSRDNVRASFVKQ